MILDEIILRNFGVYGGVQSAILTPDADRPIVLFGGLNGGGKTTLLDAVQLAFYGSNARTSNRGKLTYRDYLRRAIHGGADPGEGASITIRFRRIMDGIPRHYQLARSWREGVKGIEEFVEVSCDGEPDSVLSEHWAEYIEGYLPSGVAHLFFFDAEQIKELAEGEHAAEILGTAIHSLLGLDLVDRLDTDLRVLERRKRTESLDPVARAQLDDCRCDLVKADSEIDALVNRKAKLTNEAHTLAKALRVAEQSFVSEGGELFQRRQEMEADLARLVGEKQIIEDSLREIAAGPAPLLFVQDLLAEAEAKVRHEAEIRHARVLVKALETRDQEILDQLKRSKLPKSSLERIQKVFSEDRSRRQGLAEEPVLLGAGEELALEIRHICGRILPQVRDEIVQKLAAVDAIEEKIARIQSQLVRVPDEDAIAAIQRELTLAKQAHVEKMAEIAQAEMQIELVKRQKSAIEVKMDRLGFAKLESDASDDDRARILRHSEKVRVTLARFREQVVKRHAGRLESLMLECFTRLLRKTGLVRRLAIDPNTFEVSLTGGDGNPLPVERLSSGERQLLATAMLWGLARASGRPIPTIIDTPLGRLDSSHRRHLVERYFPVASHQVILLSTDEEIIENHLETLQPSLARTYHLAFDEKLRNTQIELGYFKNHATTS